MKPYFELSKSKALEQFDKIKSFSDKISYSSKTNPKITKILEKERDCWFSIHFENELKNISDLSRVLFLAQAWSLEEIKRLIEKGIKKFVIDNESDLDILLEFLKKEDIEIDLFLRLRLKENTIKTEKYYVFGMYSSTINKRIKELKDNKKIKHLGIHFHRKTQNMAEWNLKYEISRIIEEEVFDIIDYINIGGGIPAEYANTDIRVLKGIFSRLIEFKEFLKLKNIKLIIEPGRFISAPSIKLITEIIGVYENNIVINASVYNTNLDALIVGVKLLVKGETDSGEFYVIKGCTPCSMDLFRYKVFLENPKVGDKITFLNAGAYNFASDFCELEKLETKITR